MKRSDNNTFNLEELEKLQSGQLNEMLRQELDRSHKDEAFILRILHILEQRHTAQTYGPEAAADLTQPQADRTFPVHKLPTGRDPARSRKAWLGRAVAAAVIVCLLVVFVPRAEGKRNLFEAIGKWTQDLFSFFSDANQEDEYTFTTDDSGLQAIYDAVAAQGAQAAVVPTWIPEGYELTELKVLKASGGNKIHACLLNGDSYILLTYEFHEEEATNKYAKDDMDTEVYEYGGVKYYLMSNEEMWASAWTVENLECSIATNLTEEMLRQILISIHQEVI